MCMNLNFLLLSGGVMNAPEKRVRPEDGMVISRFYLRLSENGPVILCKSYGQLAEKVEKIPAGAGVLCQGRLETIEIPTGNGAKSYLTELVLSDAYPAVANAGVNIFMVAGRSVKDGDFFIGEGEKKAFCSSRMAVNRQVGEGQRTEYISVKSFEKKAEFAAKWIKRGTPFYAKGVLSISDYTDKNGQKQRSYDLLARDIGFTSDKGSSSSQAAPAQPPMGVAQTPPAATGTDGAGVGGGFSSGGFNTGWGNLPI